MSDTTLSILQLVGCGALGGAMLVIVGLVIGILLGWRCAAVAR